MRYLRQSTTADIVIGPVVSTTDYSRKTDLAAAGIDCDAYKSGVNGAVTLANSAGDGYWRHSANGYYLLTLSTGNTDTCGRLRITLDATGYTAPPLDFTVLSAKVYDSIVAGTDNLEVDIVQWLGATAPGSAGTLPAVAVSDKTGFALTSAYDAAKTANATAPDNASIGLIKAKTDSLTFTTPGKVDATATVDTTTLATSAQVAAIPSAVNTTLSSAHGAGAWGQTIAGDVEFTQASQDTSGDVIGRTTAGAYVTAYLSSDIGRDTPLRQDIAEPDGDWSIWLTPGSTYTLVFSKNGYEDATAEVTA